MTSLQVVVPYLGYSWCLQDMLSTFGDSDVPILIVDNSPNSDLDRGLHGSQDWIPASATVEYHPNNIGVAASWNRALRLGADQTLLCSQWVRFAPLEESSRPDDPSLWGLRHVARGIGQWANRYGMTFGNQGYHLISIGRETVEKVGYFDENFYPTYGEDYDYERRLLLADNIMMGGWPKDGWLESGIYSIAYAAFMRAGVLPPKVTNMADYMTFKWRSLVPGEGYNAPFGNPDNSIKYWPDVIIGSGKKWND